MRAVTREQETKKESQIKEEESHKSTKSESQIKDERGSGRQYRERGQIWGRETVVEQADSVSTADSV